MCYNPAIVRRDVVKARLIYNPTAGPWGGNRTLRRIRSCLKRKGWVVDPQVTEGPGDATAIAREAAQAGYDAVVVAGGDGTVNETVNGLVGTETALGVLPVGTGNLWARQLGVSSYVLANPLRLQEAANGLAAGIVRRVDVGVANEHCFLCWAGIGLDAQVTTEMEPRPRHTKHLGTLPYVVATVLVARHFKGVRTRVHLDGGLVRSRTVLILVSNIQRYGGMLHVSREARIDDGLLDVFVFKGLGFSYTMRHLLTMLRRRYLQDPRILHRQARNVEVLTDPAVPVQVDGDIIGETPVTLGVIPRALRVLIPPTAPPDLFASERPPESLPTIR
jgi:YegS/Rv2252/BmrU family lipid kinase